MILFVVHLISVLIFKNSVGVTIGKFTCLYEIEEEQEK